MRLAQQLITALSSPFDCNHTQVEIGATVGIAVMPQDGSDADSLLHCADIAMYRGKREGRSTFRFFEAAMDEELKARAALECELRSAIGNGQIKPHYQPLVSLSDRQLLGFEVLARWYHPARGPVHRHCRGHWPNHRAELPAAARGLLGREILAPSLALGD